MFEIFRNETARTYLIFEIAVIFQSRNKIWEQKHVSVLSSIKYKQSFSNAISSLDNVSSLQLSFLPIDL